MRDNLTTGLTIVSGAHLVAFGGTILATGNRVHGVSGDSKAGLDLDAAAVLAMFNTPAFSGAPGVTMLNMQNNLANGVSVLTGSNLTVIPFAAVNSRPSAGAVIFVNNGSALTLVGSI